MIEYTIKIDNGVEMARIVEGNDVYEVPIPIGTLNKTEWVYNKVEEFKYYEMLQSQSLMVTYKDNVYMNGELVRTDINVMVDDAASVINQLIDAFPQYTEQDIKDNSNNVIGTYGNYRPPYNNNSISLYRFERPSQDLLNTYKCGNMYDNIILDWYGIKHDLSTLDISAKIVFKPEDCFTYFNNPPNINNTNSAFFARIHNVDGTFSDWVDMYVFETNAYMKEYCQSIGKPFPLPDNITQQCWIYSIIFNDVTGEINNVKGYIRQNLA